jgi:hypothetical protein
MFLAPKLKNRQKIILRQGWGRWDMVYFKSQNSSFPNVIRLLVGRTITAN